MADAPEKIWAVEGLSEILSFNTYDNGGLSYTRTDAAADRIEELNNHCRDLEAKLAKAVVSLENGERLISGELTGVEWKRACNDFLRDARATLAELSSASCANTKEGNTE